MLPVPWFRIWTIRNKCILLNKLRTVYCSVLTFFFWSCFEHLRWSCRCCGRVSSVGNYSDWLRAGRSGDRIPVADGFNSTIQTVPGPAHHRVSSPEVKWPPPIRLELYLYCPSGPSWPVREWTWRSAQSLKLWKYCQHRKCFWNCCSAAWPFRAEPSSDHAVPTAAVCSVRELCWQVSRSLRYQTVRHYIAAHGDDVSIM
jgi:hypothetical protein